MATSPVSLLIFGLSFKASQALNPQVTQAFFDKIFDSIKTLDNVPKLKYQVYELDHRATTGAESMQDFKKLLAQGPASGGHWDGLLIGAGVRLISDMIPILEDTLNTAASTSKGTTKIMFSANAADHKVVVKRAFPELDISV